MEEIYREVEELDKEKVMDIMRTLINIDTTVPPGNAYQEYINALSPYFRELGYELEEVAVPDEYIKQIPYDLIGKRVNLVATKDYGQENDVSFYGHMDVVPAPTDGKQKWRFPPFEATMSKTGKIFGRGTADMKGSMACLIVALQIIQKLNLTPKYNITVMNCTDEEIGVYPGVKYLAEQGYVKGTVFCMEGVVNPFIIVGAAGALNVIMESYGRSCHSGVNFFGINALEETVPILVELMKLKKIVEVRENEGIPGLPRVNIKPGEKVNEFMTPMFNLDIINSGTKANIVPDLCTLTINRRWIPAENIEEVKQEILNAIEKGKAKSKLLDVKTTFIYDYPAMKVNPNAPDVTRIKKVISLVQGVEEDKIPVIGMSGSTDMGNISEILSTEDIIMHGPGNAGSNSHGVNEFIRWKDIVVYIKELIVFLCAEL